MLWREWPGKMQDTQFILQFHINSKYFSVSMFQILHETYLSRNYLFFI